MSFRREACRFSETPLCRTSRPVFSYCTWHAPLLGGSLPARRIGLSHQLVHRFCLAVEYRTGLLAAQHDELEHVPKHPVELAAAVTKADWRQTRELRPARILSLRSYRRSFSTRLEPRVPRGWIKQRGHADNVSRHPSGVSRRVTRTRWWGAALRFRAGRKHCRRALLTEVRLQQDKGAPSTAQRLHRGGWRRVGTVLMINTGRPAKRATPATAVD